MPKLILLGGSRDKIQVPDLVASLRELGYQETITLFSGHRFTAGHLRKVEVRPVRNDLGHFAVLRRAIRELAKQPPASDYLFLRTECRLAPKFPAAVAAVDDSADVWFPYATEELYTSVFAWDAHPYDVWFSRSATSFAGDHCFLVRSHASLQRLDQKLPTNSWTDKSFEQLLLEAGDQRVKNYYPSVCWSVAAPGREFVDAVTANRRVKRREFRKGDKLRIGFVVQVLLCGGTETWLLNLLAGLSRYGDVALTGVVVAGVPAAAYAPTVSQVAKFCPIYTEGEFASATTAASNAAIGRLVEESDILVVWAITDHADLTELVKAECRVVGVNHGCFDWWMRRLDKYIDAWATVSNVSLKALPRPGTVIHNGLHFSASGETATSAKTRLGLPLNTTVCGYIGRLSPEKRIKELCRDFDRLPADEFSLLVVGPPSPFIDFTKYRGANFFVHPATTDVASYLAACDLTVLASESEGFGYAPLESILAGVPVVATRVGIVGELMTKFPDAFVEIKQATKSEEIDIREAMQQAKAKLPLMRRSLPALARYVREQLSLDKMADGWRAFLRSVCERR